MLDLLVFTIKPRLQKQAGGNHVDKRQMLKRHVMGLLWFVDTPFGVAITVAIAGFVLVEAMSLLRHACGMDVASAPLP